MLAHCSLTAVKPIQGQVRSFFIRLLFFPPPPLFFSYMFSGILPFHYSILEKNLLAFLQIFPISSHPCKNISSIASIETSPLLLCQKKNPSSFRYFKPGIIWNNWERKWGNSFPFSALNHLGDIGQNHMKDPSNALPNALSFGGSVRTRLAYWNNSIHYFPYSFSAPHPCGRLLAAPAFRPDAVFPVTPVQVPQVPQAACELHLEGNKHQVPILTQMLEDHLHAHICWVSHSSHTEEALQ